MNRAIIDYYRCPEDLARLVLDRALPEETGFFRYGSKAICYGRCSATIPAAHVTDHLYDVSPDVTLGPESVRVPFDLTSVIDNLRLERYMSSMSGQRSTARRILQDTYYVLRPFAPSFIRRAAQRTYYRRWQSIPFPRWPVDYSVDQIFQNLLVSMLRSQPAATIPFIWFWPKGMSSCAVMTHDVETARGRDFCSSVMDVDDSFGIKSAFQVVPEGSYVVSDAFLAALRNRGFEINIHDLNHDGRLFRDKRTFFARAAKINHYARQYGASGFRSGAMYRQPDWIRALDISYDMSVPNAAHMEPQRGGCCTVMPYFIGDILELPLTATQDFALFNVLRQDTCELWKEEIDSISAEHGLISFIIHPDYTLSAKAQQVYAGLLTYLSQLRSNGKRWIALPREVNHWWRQRAQMRLFRRGGRWSIDGPDAGRAQIAYVRLVNNRLVYAFETAGKKDIERSSGRIVIQSN